MTGGLLNDDGTPKTEEPPVPPGMTKLPDGRIIPTIDRVFGLHKPKGFDNAVLKDGGFKMKELSG